MQLALGKQLGELCRHFLLMTATPHNGKEIDFQLFMALLDADRFEGKFRDGVHTSDTSDLMRRLVKEQLLKFDGTPLFPERLAYSVEYQLSEGEAALYRLVTDYVSQEMNRAERLEGGRGNVVGFALTVLQRRPTSRPSAARPATWTDCGAPTPSTLSSSTGFATIGPPWSASSAPGACSA